MLSSFRLGLHSFMAFDLEYALAVDSKFLISIACWPRQRSHAAHSVPCQWCTGRVAGFSSGCIAADRIRWFKPRSYPATICAVWNSAPPNSCSAQRPRLGRCFSAPRAPSAPAPVPTLSTGTGQTRGRGVQAAEAGAVHCGMPARGSGDRAAATRACSSQSLLHRRRALAPGGACEQRRRTLGPADSQKKRWKRAPGRYC